MNPQKSEKQVMQAKSYISDSFDYSHEFQNYGKKHDFQEYRVFDRSLTPKMGDNNGHLEQVRSFIIFEKWISRTNDNYLM